jgi:hypothetical protein
VGLFFVGVDGLPGRSRLKRSDAARASLHTPSAGFVRRRFDKQISLAFGRRARTRQPALLVACIMTAIGDARL